MTTERDNEKSAAELKVNIAAVTKLYESLQAEGPVNQEIIGAAFDVIAYLRGLLLQAEYRERGIDSGLQA